VFTDPLPSSGRPSVACVLSRIVFTEWLLSNGYTRQSILHRQLYTEMFHCIVKFLLYFLTVPERQAYEILPRISCLSIIYTSLFRSHALSQSTVPYDDF
jgi:hypothetical protein